MMRHRLSLAAATAVLVAASAGAASAACTRHVYNQSPYLLAVSQNGGPATMLRPGASEAVRMDSAGRLELSAFCPDPSGAPATPAAQAAFDYVADPGICFVKWGYNGLTPYANRIDLANGTAPFVVNNPHQGDVVLGPFGPACPSADQALTRKY